MDMEQGETKTEVSPTKISSEIKHGKIPWEEWQTAFEHLKWDGKTTNWRNILTDNQNEIRLYEEITHDQRLSNNPELIKKYSHYESRRNSTWKDLKKRVKALQESQISPSLISTDKPGTYFSSVILYLNPLIYWMRPVDWSG